MFDIPTSITIKETNYKIRNRGDFRVIFDIFEALNDIDLEPEYRVYTSLIIFYEDINSIEDINDTFGENIQEAINEMYKFINCGQDESPGAKVNYTLVNWTQDAQLIASAVNNVAKKEIRFEEYLHWWTFMGYYLAIGDSPFSLVVSIRSKIKKGKKLEQHEKEFKKENPQYFIWDSNSVETRQFEQNLMEMWNKGG